MFFRTAGTRDRCIIELRTFAAHLPVPRIRTNQAGGRSFMALTTRAIGRLLHFLLEVISTSHPLIGHLNFYTVKLFSL